MTHHLNRIRGGEVWRVASLVCFQLSRSPGVTACLICLTTLLLWPHQTVYAASTPAIQKDWERRNSAGAYVIRKGDYIYIGNAYMERIFRTSDQALRTVAWLNKLSHAAPNYRESHEFELELEGKLQGNLSTTDFRLEDISVSAPSADTLRTSFMLRSLRDSRFSVVVSIESYGGRKYQRKWLDVDWDGEGDVIVERVDVEVIRLGWWNIGRVTHSGYGQPVFAADIYMGLEYPGAETTESYLRHYPGRSARGGMRSKSAIWGVASDSAATESAFNRDYLRTIRKDSTPFVIYNLLFFSMSKESILTSWIDKIGSDAKKAGFQINSFALDDGWQDESTVWEPSPEQFPNGLGLIAKQTISQQSGLGLWMSLVGSTLETRWGERYGLEVANIGDRFGNGRYCLAGPKYSARLLKALDKYLVEDRVNYFKFDYNVFKCDDPTHGHPIGRAGKDAQIDAYIDILKHIKTVAPNAFVAITSGMWLSPWWTEYADAVWLGGSDLRTDEMFAGVSAHDQEMTYRDTVMYDDFRVKKYVFPYRNVMTHGFWTQKDTSFSKFKDDAMLTIGRGITKWEILTSPEVMDAKRYEFLGRAIGWGKANWDLLSETEMILGDPGKGEVYGYLHHGSGATLLFLRNPSLESRVVDISSQLIGTPSGSGSEAFEVYPIHGPLDRDSSSGIQVELLGTQTKCIAVVWDKKLASRLRL